MPSKLQDGYPHVLIQGIMELPAEGALHFKILVPSVAAGAIIGKGGETIAQLQKEAGARVKMSKANDYYPGTAVSPGMSTQRNFGTAERVCLITGTMDAIMRVHDFIMEKIREKPDPNAKPAIDFDSKQPAEREKQVKILVPNSTAGMIIGKGGNYIKQIKEESGSYVQISQKAKDQTLTERCITVIGEIECNRNACAMILAKIMEDPQSGSCLNVSYADVTGPVANFNPTGSPYANPAHAGGNMINGSFSSNGSLNSMSPGLGTFGGTTGSPLAGLNISLNLNPMAASGPSPSLNTAQLIESIKATLRGSGYSEQATAEITSAMTTLANYGILGLGLGIGSNPLPSNMSGATTPGFGGGLNIGVGGSPGGPGGPMGPTTNSGLFGGNGVTAMDTTPIPQTSGMPSNNVFGPIGSVASGSMGSPTNTRPSDRYGDVYDPFRRNSPSLGSPGASNGLPVNNNSFGLGTSSALVGLRKSPTPSDKANDATKIEVEVGENIVGAILGPGGKSLVEIQHFSGANIQISKKGIFAPGTRNRIVTITGTLNAISTAQYLIEQRISEEESKRARQNMLGVMR